MSAVLRTVRRLDEHTETRTVAGIEIETGVPIPSRKTKNSPITQALLALQPGESLVHANRAEQPRRNAQRSEAGRVYVGRPIGGGKWRIWRTK